MTDFQAAIGNAQIDKLPDFITVRHSNFEYLNSLLKPLSEYFVLPVSLPNSEPSWFGYPLTIKPTCGFTRRDITTYLETSKIGTRLLFGGNLLKQPAYQNITFRQLDELINTNIIADQTFWIGVYPGITTEMMNYMAETIFDFVKKHK